MVYLFITYLHTYFTESRPRWWRRIDDSLVFNHRPHKYMERQIMLFMDIEQKKRIKVTATSSDVSKSLGCPNSWNFPIDRSTVLVNEISYYIKYPYLYARPPRAIPRFRARFHRRDDRIERFCRVLWWFNASGSICRFKFLTIVIFYRVPRENVI